MVTVKDLRVDNSDDDGLEVVVEEQISRSDEGQEQFANIVEEQSLMSDEGQQQFESIASEIPSKIKRKKLKRGSGNLHG